MGSLALSRFHSKNKILDAVGGTADGRNRNGRGEQEEARNLEFLTGNFAERGIVVHKGPQIYKRQLEHFKPLCRCSITFHKRLSHRHSSHAVSL